MKPETISTKHKNQMSNPTKIIQKIGSRVRVATLNEEASETQQQFKDECDINNIMKKYGRDPVAFQALTRPGGQYADFSQITDFHTMVNQVFEAETAFQSLPAHLRAKFKNDPGQLITFIQDPKNLDESINLGLLVKTEINPSHQNMEPNPKNAPPPKPTNQKLKNQTPATSAEET